MKRSSAVREVRAKSNILLDPWDGTGLVLASFLEEEDEEDEGGIGYSRATFTITEAAISNVSSGSQSMAIPSEGEEGEGEEGEEEEAFLLLILPVLLLFLPKEIGEMVRNELKWRVGGK